MFRRENKVNMTNKHVESIRKYKSATPWYCKNWYWLIVLAATVLDWITLFSLYDVVLNGNMFTALVTTFAVTTVLDIYSIWLPVVLKRMNRNKKNIVFGIILGGIIISIGVFSIVFRINTGDVSTSTEEVVLTPIATTLLSFVLGLVPIASTAALLYLSIQKEEWDEANTVYRNKQMLIILNTQKKELECSQDDVIKLEELDNELLKANVELVKAYANRDKIVARIKLAEALGDSESAECLSRSAVISESIIESLQPKPMNDTETM